ncbi:lactose-binding lectin l-2-like [Onychostoma macrolepis]|uniref:C-type lectin domain-containing protein n=1 Tax=Onychostoma macrolepis TaxID=369639 RepID=A0A7J6CWJ3_9TELE|nr:lactose-binding lectin l-2-like [Onychostoma macrolepis]KAF4111718.1 hypothetical protein G5714_008749 [Onychostoma macrolepis]
MRIGLIFVLISALSSSVNSYVFNLVSERMSWTEAQTYCRQHHTDLATFNNQTDINELLQSLPGGLSSLMWIGLYRTDEYSPWVWSDGSTCLFTPWDSSQPNNSGGNQDCACMSNGYWNDWWCTEQLPFICYTEKKRQMVRLEVQSRQNMNDPVVRSRILAKLERRLKESGLADAKLSWRTFSGDTVFHKMWYQQSDASNASCKRTTN